MEAVNVRSAGDRWFDGVNNAVLLIISVLCLIPFIHVLAKSISKESAVVAGKVGLIPQGFEWHSYSYVLLQSGFFNAMKISVIVTLLGTFLSLVVTLLAAYPLSKQQFRGRKVILYLYVIAMLFYGGIIPSYLLVKSLGLLNTLFSMMLPFIVVPFNLFVVKTFMEGIPEEMEESAKVDGASNIRILYSIVLPVSLPVLATIGLFYGVGYWNNYFHPLLFISTPDLKPLQLFLYDMINSTGDQMNQANAEQALLVSTEGVRAATIVVSMIPVLLVYPFLQRYFVKGLTIGSVKG
jgi:putative aldouronate transport system permease protein